MPLYLDTHNKVDGLNADMIAEAHRRDVEVQQKYGVTYYRYWFDESTGRVYCLFEAPDADTGAAVHREAHGAMADMITEVTEGG
jgi:uncharacterized protein DUF4242